MFRTKIIVILFTCLAVTACDRGAASFRLREEKKIVISENRHVLSDLPLKAQLVSDTAIALLSDGQHLGIYDIHTGKCLQRLNSTMINGDSLRKSFIDRSTYQKNYKPSEEQPALDEQPLQLIAFHYSEGKYYLFIDIPVLVSYTDAAAFASSESELVSSNAQLQQLISSGKELSFSVQESLSLLLITDSRFRILSCIPALTDHIPQLKGKYIMPGKNFHVSGDKLLMPVSYNMITSFSDSVVMGKADTLMLMASFILKNDTMMFDRKVLGSDMLDISNMTTEDYAFAPYFFHETAADTIISNGMGFYSLRTAKPVIAYKPQERLERTSGFVPGEDHFIYITQQGAAWHSPAVQWANVVNTENGKVMLREKLGSSKAMSTAIRGSRIVQVQKDKEHYYIVTYALEE